MRLPLLACFCLSAARAAGRIPSTSHLKIMMTYDFDEALEHAWTNVASGDGASLATMLDAHKRYGLQGMPTLPGDVFQRSKAPKGLYPGWEAAVERFAAGIGPGIANGTYAGVFLGDEICCAGVPLADLAKVADKLRTLLGSGPILYTNECTVMSKWPAVPASLDYISVDFYDEHNTDGAAEVEKNRKYYTETIYSKLHPHQGVLFVPGIFASDPAHCTDKSQGCATPCPLDAQAAQIVAKLDGFFAWAKNDSRVAGFNPWHFSNRSGAQLHGCWDQRLGAASMPTVVDKLAEIGKYIISLP